MQRCDHMALGLGLEACIVIKVSVFVLSYFVISGVGRYSHYSVHTRSVSLWLLHNN